MPNDTVAPATDGAAPAHGRFAPSPTGPLHFGSLVAALASYLDARSRGGAWSLRIEDLDPPREAPGAAESILRTLDALGLSWDDQIVYQSMRADRYARILDRLIRERAAFACTCTRREIADSGLTGIDAPVYPGTCRSGIKNARAARAWRLRVGERSIEFDDAVQGRIVQDLARDVGDFVLRRADGVFAYQLAVVIDDADAGITRVTRGADLLDSTPRQIFLQSVLGLPQPAYLHVPVATNARGEKLSKQTRAISVDAVPPSLALNSALAFLGQDPSPQLLRAPVRQILDWARAHWRPDAIPRTRTRAAPIEFA